MTIFGFLFYLGIINIIFGFFWKWVIVLPMALILTIAKLEIYGMRAVKVFGTYLLVSLVALLTLTALGKEPSGLALLFYPLIGAFVLVMGFASNQYEARKEAHQTNNYYLMQRLEQDTSFEMFATVGAIVFYIFALFVPAVSANALIVFLFGVIDWAYNLPIIGFLLGIGGVFFLLSTIFYGVFAIGGLAALAINKIKGEKPSDARVVATEEPAKLS